MVVSRSLQAEAKPAGASNTARIGSGNFFFFFTYMLRWGELPSTEDPPDLGFNSPEVESMASRICSAESR